LDYFHASHCFMDGRSGCKFRPRRDASITGVGNNFGSHELSVPAHIVELVTVCGGGKLLFCVRPPHPMNFSSLKAKNDQGGL